MKQFSDFAFVGLTIAIVDFGLTFLLKDIVAVNEYIANTLAVSTAVVIKFFLHRHWVFKEEADSNKSKERTKFAKFVIVNGAGVGINTFIIYILTFINISGQSWFYVNKLFATVVVLVWNFFINKFWTFKRHVD